MVESLINHMQAKAARLRKEAEADRIYSEDGAQAKMAAAITIERALEEWLCAELSAGDAASEGMMTKRWLRQKFPGTGSGRNRTWTRRELIAGPAEPEQPAEAPPIVPPELEDLGGNLDEQGSSDVLAGVAEALRNIA